jgi:hypothetical protein
MKQHNTITAKRGEYLKLFIIFFILFAIWTKPALTSWNDESRMAQIQSIVKHGSLIIDKSSFSETGDKYFFNNHFYSDKPPLLAFYALPFYWILRQIGISFEKNFGLTYYLLTLLSIGALSAFGLIVFRKIIIDFFHVSNEWADITTFITGVGTLVFPYSLIFNNHVPSGVLILLGFYFFLDFKKNSMVKNAVFSGLFFSLAGSIDISCFIFIPFILVPILKKSKIAGLIFGMSCVPAIGLYLFFNFSTSGSLLPPAMNASLWNYPGSFFGQESLSGLAKHNNVLDVLCYSLHMLIGNRGLISHTPILLFSILGIFIIYRKNSQFQLKLEYSSLLFASLLFIAIYIFRSTNYSGFAFGVRWFASLMFILCLPIACLESSIRSSRTKQAVFLGIACLSIFISLVGAYAPISPLVVADMEERSPANTMLVNFKFIIHDFSNVVFMKCSMREIVKISRLVISGCILYFLLYGFMKNLSKASREYAATK